MDTGEKEAFVEVSKVYELAKLVDKDAELVRYYEYDDAVLGYVYIVTSSDNKINEVKALVSKILGNEYAGAVFTKKQGEIFVHYG